MRVQWTHGMSKAATVLERFVTGLGTGFIKELGTARAVTGVFLYAIPLFLARSERAHV